MKYMVVQAESLKELEEKVNSLLEKGWEPLGGVAIILTKRPMGPGGMEISVPVPYQALVCRNATPKPD